MSMYRFRDASTSAEVSSLSLWKSTPFRTVMVTSLPSADGSYFSSRSIFGPFFESRVKSPSYICQPMLAVTVAVVKTGSNAGGSPMMAHLRMPPFFGSPAAGLAAAAGFASAGLAAAAVGAGAAAGAAGFVSAGLAAAAGGVVAAGAAGLDSAGLAAGAC
jgi:hypothetical protein